MSVILSSGSIGTKQEDIQAVLEKHGYEVDKPEVQEPKREDFQDQESFDAALAEHQETHPPAQSANDGKEKKTRVQRAVDKHTEKLRADLSAAQARIAELEKGKQPETKTEPTPTEPKKPQRADFPNGADGDAQFAEADFDYRYEKRKRDDAAQDAEKRQTEANNKQVETNYATYQEKVAEFKESHADWDDVMSADIPCSVNVQLAIHEMENGPDVAYYLGKHSDYARDLANKTPLSQVMEIGRLSERLKPTSSTRANGGNSGQVAPKKLPAPVEPVSTAATRSSLTTKDAAADKNFQAFKQARRGGR